VADPRPSIPDTYGVIRRLFPAELVHSARAMSPLGLDASNRRSVTLRLLAVMLTDDADAFPAIGRFNLGMIARPFRTSHEEYEMVPDRS
jgi:hypothetical protein